jgi:hypothetical protein
MKHAAIAIVSLLAMALTGSVAAAGSPPVSPHGAAQRVGIPRPVKVARTTAIPRCTLFVDGGFAGVSKGTPSKPYKSIVAAVDAAKPAAIICVAGGVYAETLAPGTKAFTLAGGFRHGKLFKVRDSARYVSKADGDGGSFIRIEDPGPSGKELTAVDGFEITGYAQAVVRDFYISQRFDLTNNFIHDNSCADSALAGAGFSLNNVSGAIRGNVFVRNVCGRGGAGALFDALDENTVVIEKNLIKENEGNEPQISHGGGLYLFTNRITVRANAFVKNSVTGWGAGLYVGAFTGGGQHTSANLAWNLYQDNGAGIAGGGLFCDDSAKCLSDHEIYDGNCGGNIYLDSGPGGAGPTVAQFDHLTNHGARSAGCGSPGAGVQIDKDNGAPDNYSFTNAIFWANAPHRDFATSCGSGCGATVRVTYSMVDKQFLNGGVKITFGPGILAPRNPRLVSPPMGNVHLKSTFGHWTPSGYVPDTASSPALAQGDPTSPVDRQPARAGDRTELGAYGNSPEASYVR